MASPNPKPANNVGEGATITTIPDAVGVNHFQFRPLVPMFGGADHGGHFDETAPPALERTFSWEDLEGPDGALADDSEDWECSRCTFRNSALVRTCDLCEAPRFAKAMLVSNSPEDTIRTNPNPVPQSSIFNTMEDFLQGASAFPALPSELKLAEAKSDPLAPLPEPLKLSADEPAPAALQAPQPAASEERVVLPSPVAPPESPVDVVFIGAGPVGLWTALQVKVHRPNWRILLLEKHQEYQRKHVLKINLSSFDHARTLKNTLLNNLIDSLQAYVRTSDLEAKLRLAALHLGIEIRFESVTSVAQVIKQFPSVSIIVGTDGSHSIVRQQVFGGHLAIQESLQHIVDFKYEVQGRAMKLRFFDQAYPTLKLMSHVVDEHVGKFSEAEGTTPVTLRLLIDPETYNRVKDATFKNPFYVPTHREQLGETLVESLTIWLNAKSMLVGEVRVPGSERLSALHLSVYRSTTLAAIKTVENTDGKPRAFCLAGDSAFGVPFFRALNNGLICGSQLAAALTVGQLTNPGSPTAEDTAQHCTVPTEHALLAYQHFVEQLADKEIGVARRKKALLSLAQLTSKVNSMVPWQVVRWSDDKVRSFKTMNPGFSAPASALPPASTTAGTEAKHGETVGAAANVAGIGAHAHCKFCGVMFTGETNRRGQCAHRGALHSLYAHCNATCAIKLSFPGHSIPTLNLARNHWGCCYALEDQKWCPNSGPHAADVVQCTLCFRNVDPFNNQPGGCGHTGSWHDKWTQCGVTCAAKMAITQYGHNHWSCCYSTDQESPCKNSPPHILAPHSLVETAASVCRKCGLPFDPMHNASGQCAHIADWHTSVTQCSVKCVKGLGFQNIGKQHWGCCFSTAHNSMCTKSDVHEV